MIFLMINHDFLLESKDGQKGIARFVTIITAVAVDRRSIHSSNATDISFLRYDEENHIMEISFGEVLTLQYFDIPPVEYEMLLNADSSERYFVEHIKDHFRFIRL